MLCRQLTIWVVPLVGLAGLAAWQYHEYCRGRELDHDMLQRQADSVTNAIIAGIRYQCRQGHFSDEDVRGLLEEVVKAEDVRAAVLISSDGRLRMQAGNTDLLAQLASTDPGESWEPSGFRVVRHFVLARELGRRSHKCLCGRPQLHDEADAKSVFLAGGQFVNALLLDRSRADEHGRRAVWLRVSVVMVGGLMLICLVLVWCATLRLAKSRVALDAKSRHLRELSVAAAGLAHETRNPLSLIQGWNQRVARSNLGSSEQQHQAQAVVEECNRLTYRINQFLTLARPIEPKIVQVDPASVVEELAVLLEEDFQSKKLVLDRSGLVPGETIHADRELFRQVLFNLIRNAVQWSPESATVEVGLRRGRNGYKRLEVADRGPGVPAEAVPSLFMPYFTTRTDGTGLGLAMVHRIATAHGWEVGYSPRSGGGATFWVEGIAYG
jgi:two-component system, NtrC family, sensor histidine kinase HydH